MHPFISICIPAYNRITYLERLLDSITEQTYKDFEVIVSDDSSEEDVLHLCEKYTSRINLHYQKNVIPLGTPENWNAAIKRAKGQWIKLMHDDDWFASKYALELFANAAKENQDSFIFCDYINIYESGKKDKIITPEKYRINILKKEPAILLAKNFIGPPSVVMHNNDGRHFYDKKLKWLVDIDMYCRRIEDNNVTHISKALVNVGISKSQVTAAVKNVGTVEIPEHFYFLEKTGTYKLKNILIYDYWWRFIRNFNIRDSSDFSKYGYNGSVPVILKKMISFQKKVSPSLLQKGIISKLLMAGHFISNKKFIAPLRKP